MKDIEIFQHVAGVPNATPTGLYGNVDIIVHNSALEIVKADNIQHVWPILADFAYAIIRPVGVYPGASSTDGSIKVTINLGATWTGPGSSVTLLVPRADDITFDTSFITIINGEKLILVNPMLVISPILLEPVT